MPLKPHSHESVYLIHRCNRSIFLNTSLGWVLPPYCYFRPHRSVLRFTPGFNAWNLIFHALYKGISGRRSFALTSKSRAYLALFGIYVCHLLFKIMNFSILISSFRARWGYASIFVNFFANFRYKNGHVFLPLIIVRWKVGLFILCCTFQGLLEITYIWRRLISALNVDHVFK